MTSSPYTPQKLMLRLIRDYVRPQGKRISFAVVCMVVVAAATSVNAWIMQPVLDDIFIKHDARMLHIIPVVIFAVTLLSGAANYGQIVTMRYVGQRIISDLQLTLFRHLLGSDLALFHANASGRLISHFTNDINLMRGAVSNVLVTIGKQSLTLVGLFCVMLYQSWELTLIAFGAYPLAIYPLMRWGRRMRRLSYRSQDNLGEFSARLDEVFQGARTVKAYGREEYESEKARTIIERLFMIYYRASRVGAASSPLMEGIGGIAIGSVIWYGGTQVLAGATTPGAFSSFIAALIMAYKPAKSMSGIGSTLQEGLAAAERIFTVLDTAPTITDKPDAKALQVSAGHIAYDHVQFRYGAETAGVTDVSFEVPAGKTAALVGLSGGGKSTLMNLLLRFYEVGGGAIRIDGQDIRDVTQASLRGAMAFVPQESMLFDDTARANIAYGRLDASEAEIIEAAKNAAADDFIRQLPQGYDTMIGAHGVRLSGGQRQRIAIARAMLKNAPILLLDEATSALDNESERSIQQVLKTLMQGRTTLVIAHRLSTIVGADIIHVIEHGRLLESGTHQGLLAQKGKYYQLYARNFEMEAGS